MRSRIARRGCRAAAAFAVLLAVIGGFGWPVPPEPAAAATSRAVVVIDMGSGAPPQQFHVDFSEDHLTGIEVLRRAVGTSNVVSLTTFGLAVCKIFGVGNEPTQSQCPGAPYWAYYHSPAGSTNWVYSGAGAGATTVRDGDVEGWRWGSGAPPAAAFCSVAACAGPAAPPTTAAAVDPAPGGPNGGGGAGGTAGATAGSTGATVPPPGPDSSPDPGPAADAPSAATPDAVSGGKAGVRPRTDRGDGERALGPGSSGPSPTDDGSPVGVLLAGIVVAGIGTLAWWRRRPRV